MAASNTANQAYQVPALEGLQSDHLRTYTEF